MTYAPDFDVAFSQSGGRISGSFTISGPARILVDCFIVLTFEVTILMDPIVLLEDGAIPAPST